MDWESHRGKETGMEFGCLHGKTLVKIGLALKECFRGGGPIHLNFLLITWRLRGVLLDMCVCFRDSVLFCDTSLKAQIPSATQPRVFFPAPCFAAVNSTSVFVRIQRHLAVVGPSASPRLTWDPHPRFFCGAGKVPAEPGLELELCWGRC